MSFDISTWINTAKYTPVELIFFGIGGAGWVVCYVSVLLGIRKHKVVEIPAAAVVANMAWETTWAIIYRTDLGPLFVWGYRTWFVLDVFIFGYLLIYGAQHIANPALRRIFRPAVIIGYLGWLMMLYFFVKEGYDTTTGLTSGFVATLMMSALYLVVELEGIEWTQYSAVVPWAKLIGNGGAAVFCFMALPDVHFLLAVCVITFVLDALYVVLFYERRKEVRRARA